MQKFITLFQGFARDTRGVTLVEYGLAIALAILMGGGALTLLAGEISTALGVVGTQMPN